jgi:hypothetical protein
VLSDLSRGLLLVATATLDVEQGGQGVDGGAGIGVRIEASAAFSAEAAPVADQQRAAEQIGRSWRKVPSGKAGWNSQRRADLHPVEAMLIVPLGERG